MAARFGTAIVTGRSMRPTLEEGDRLLIAFGVAPRPGSIVVVRLPGMPLSVKRAVRRVPEGWWVERDNPEEGVDSWLLGAVPLDDVIAVALFRVWPPRVRLRRRTTP